MPHRLSFASCCLLFLFLASTARAVSPALPVIPTNIFNITSYGAVGNGTFTNTTALQSAINAAGAAGGGTVVIPAGTFLCGPVTLTNKLRLQLSAGAKLLLLPYGSYPGGTSPPDFMTVSKVHDLEVSGPGTIDGQGQAWWDANLDISLKPYLFSFSKSFQRLWFHDLILTNTPMKHIVIDGTGGDVLIENMYIHEDGNSPNTDGINLQGTNCLVRNCDISVGDDNIAMGRSSGPGSDILITNITCGTGHGISIGSITSAGESNILVVNCSFTGTEFGLRLKANNTNGGFVENITYHDITMTNVQMPIYLYSYYDVSGTGSPDNIPKITPAKAATYGAAPITANTPIWRNISFSNITAYGTSLGAAIWGRPEMLVSNVTLSRVTITAPAYCNIYNARGITISDSQFNFTSNSTFALFNAQVTISNSTLAGAQVVTLDGLTSGATNNQLSLYNVSASLGNTNLLGPSPVLTLGTRATLTISNEMRFSSNSVFNFTLGTNSGGIVATGDFNTPTGTVNITGGPGFGAGTYSLLSFNSYLNKTMPVLGARPAGYTYSLVIDPARLSLLVSNPVTPAPPTFGSPHFSNHSLLCSGGGGTTNGTYYILISSNITLPLSNWTRLSTNQFDGSGNFTFSNTVPTNPPQRFFRLQMQ